MNPMTKPKVKDVDTGKRAALPRIHLIATGGTIAGLAKPNASGDSAAYVSAQRSGESLLHAVPDLLVRATWTFEQPYAIGSQNLKPQHMLALRDCILTALRNPVVDAIVVTHGTDTLEDMLFFQYLALPAHSLNKPVVFTASMLPSDHPHADGPANLASSVDWAQGLLECVGFDEKLAVLRLGAVLNGLFTPAACVRKKGTAGLNVFDAASSIRIAGLNHKALNGSAGESLPHLATNANLAISALEGMPAQGQFSGFDTERFDSVEVPVVYCAPGSSPQNQLQDLLGRVDSGHRTVACIVVAAPGHGNIPDDCVPALKSLLQKGVNVVRASRIADGGVVQGGEFDTLDSFRQSPVSDQVQKQASGAQPVGQFFEAGDLSLPQLVVLHRLKKAVVGAVSAA